MRRWLTAAILALGLAGGVCAQAPDSVAGLVIAYSQYSPVSDHVDTYVTGLLRPDGVFVQLWTDSQRTGVDEGGRSMAPTHWTYTKNAANDGSLNFTVDNAPPLPPGSFATGPTIGPHDLQFSTPTSGWMNQSVPGSDGPFTLRPAQSGLGPANLSTLATLPPGGAVTSGFVLPGAQSLMVRAVSSSLGTFGVANAAVDSTAVVHQGQRQVGQTAAWNVPTGNAAMYNALFALTGAFPLSAAAGDQVAFLDLTAGSYTVTLSSKSGGQAMLELYFLP